MANASGENFPVALRLLPARHRRHLTNLYFFARLTDDLGDEARDAQADASEAADTSQLRLRLLDELGADVDRIYAGRSVNQDGVNQDGVNQDGVNQDAATIAGDARHGGDRARVRRPGPAAVALIQANRQDQLVTRYRTYADLQQYCELSANPVGQIVLYIFGVATPERIKLSDSICTALQLAEHWQDVAEDLGNGRIYLPGEDLELYGCTEADLAAPTASPAVRELMIFETDRASRLLDEGAPLVGTLRGAARLAVAGYLAGGRAALAAIRAQGHDVLKGTPRPDKRRLAGELVKAYVRGR